MLALSTLLTLTFFTISVAAGLRKVKVSTLLSSPGAADVSVDDATAWLVQHKPARVNASHDFIAAHAAEAVRFRNAHAWAKDVPVTLFEDYVLPFTNFDEKPEPWRALFNGKLEPLIKDATSLKDAANAVQQGIWTAFGEPAVHFKSNSTPEVLSPMSDLLVKRYGSCTAMSIFLVDGLRSCGVPARVVGIAEWNRVSGGNHNWVEAWFDGQWNFIDAAPGVAPNWNQAWFSGVAANSSEHDVLHGIYTPTWNVASKTGDYLIGWRDPTFMIPAVERTSAYKASP